MRANERPFVGLGGALREGGFDEAIGHAAAAQITCNAESSLLTDFGAKTNELLRVTRVVKIAVLFQPVEDWTHGVLVFGAAFEIYAHLMNGICPPRKPIDRCGVEVGLGRKFSRGRTHEERIEATDREVKEGDEVKEVGK